jgi:hypothetical protein
MRGLVLRFASLTGAMGAAVFAAACHGGSGTATGGASTSTSSGGGGIGNNAVAAWCSAHASMGIVLR